MFKTTVTDSIEGDRPSTASDESRTVTQPAPLEVSGNRQLRIVEDDGERWALVVDVESGEVINAIYLAPSSMSVGFEFEEQLTA